MLSILLMFSFYLLLWGIGRIKSKQTESINTPIQLPACVLSKDQRKILPMNIEKLWEEGVGEDIHMVNIDHSHKALEFKRYTDGCYRVCVCDPILDRKYVIATNASHDDCSVFIRRAFQGNGCFDF